MDQWLVVVNTEDFDNPIHVESFDNYDDAEQHYIESKRLYVWVALTKVIKEHGK